MMFDQKRIVLGVTGGIAAYKAVALTSKLTQAGATVKVIMTNGAQQFVTPLSFQAVSKQPVYLDTFKEVSASHIQHIELADWADAFVVAPATANIIGKYANGIADDMLSTTLLATEAPIYIAPAMNVHMYQHQAVQANLKTLSERGCQIIEPDVGYLAEGYVGKGRLAEPEAIFNYLADAFKRRSLLQGKKVLISAGPTKEKIDPVRFFTNHSSGKMGYALAEAAAKLGAMVTLISGPVQLDTPKDVKRIDVTSAEEMYQAMLAHYHDQDIVIKSAAVADYRPVKTYDQKLKKQPGMLQIELERTRDILKELGKQKEQQYLVGFAAETDQIKEYGKAKLIEKNLDAIVINDISLPGAGFGTDTNEVHLITKTGMEEKIALTSKQAIAEQLLHFIIKEIGVD